MGGFTLIELIVVVVVVGVLTAIAVPSFLAQRRNGFDAQTVSDVRNLAHIKAGLVAAHAAPVIWQTGDDPALVDGFSGTGQVQHKTRLGDDGLDWCVAGWHPRGNRNSVQSPVWVASDSPVVSTQEIPAGTICERLLGVEGVDPDEGAPDDDLDLGAPGPVPGGYMVLVFDTNVPGGDGSVGVQLEGVGAGTTIDWGDGSPVVAAVDGVNSHTFSGSGRFEVRIEGTFKTFGGSTFLHARYLTELVEVAAWAGTQTVSAERAFAGTTNLTFVTQPPSTVTNFSAMFDNSAFNQPLDGWDTSNVTDMSLMFREARTFNQPLDGWDTSNVTSMQEMFWHAIRFNQPLDGWDTSNVTNMRGLFQMAHAFNQPLDGWDTSGVTDMQSMFESAFAFNRPIGSWDTSQVVTMNRMFHSAIVFNQDLSCWNVSGITTPPAAFTDNSGWGAHLRPQWGTTGC